MPDGQRVLSFYRGMETLTAQAIEGETATLRMMPVDISDGK